MVYLKIFQRCKGYCWAAVYDAGLHLDPLLPLFTPYYPDFGH